MRFDPVLGWIDDNTLSFGRGAASPTGAAGVAFETGNVTTPVLPPESASATINQPAVNFAGFSPQDIGSYFGGLSDAQATALIMLANEQGQSLSPSQNDLLREMQPNFAGPQGIEAGLGYLSQHPKGSKVHSGGFGNFLTDVLNVTPFTGFGAINLSEGRFNVPGSGAHVRDWGRSMSNLATGEQMRPEVQSAWATPEARMGAMALGTAGRIAAGYGLGSALAAGPATGPEGIPYVTDPSGFAAQQVMIDPATGAALPGAGLTPDQVGALYGTAGGLSGGAQGALGASALSTLAGMFEPQPWQQQLDPMQRTPSAPGQAPGQAQVPNRPQGGGGRATEDTSHIGLARRFEDRIKGAREAPGLTSLQDIQRNYGYYMGR